ncbi:unnamed protein product [Prunus armeniaca]
MGKGRRMSWTRLCGTSKKRCFSPTILSYDGVVDPWRSTKTGSVKDYVATFTNLLFEVSSMTDEEKLIHVQTLSEVIAAAESLVEFKKNDQGDFKFKGKKGSSGSSGEDNKPKEGSKS